jgi:signal transduction histidine kinase
MNTVLGLLAFLKRLPNKKVNISFAILSWALGVWNFCGWIMYLPKGNPLWEIFWVRMGFMAMSITPSAFFTFSWLLTREESVIPKWKLIVVWVPSLVFVLASLTRLMVRSVALEIPMLNYGPAHPFFGIYVLLNICGALFLLLKSYRNSFGLKRLQIRYCFWGMLISSVFAITPNLVLPLFGTSRLNELGPPSTIIMISFITYAIVKHRLMDINIVFKKGTTYLLLMLLLFIPSVILILLTQELFFKEINYLFSAIILSLLMLTTFLFHHIEPGTEKAVENFLFKNKYDYRETLGRFSKAMVSILDLQSLCKRIIETIAHTMGVEKVSLFLWDEEKGAYELRESKNMRIASSSLILTKGEPLPHYLQKIEEIVVRDELFKGAHLRQLKSVIDQMSLLESEVSIPLISKGQLVGIMNLSQKFNKEIYYHEDIELLSTLANQASIAIENARLYEDLKKSKSYMRRADRLASLGTLTAGLAHEIRNPLVAIKTFTQLLPERFEDEEFRSHFLSIASSEVDRISSLINELLDFARPSEPKLEFEDINSILDGMILLVSTETKKKQIDVIKKYMPDLCPIKIDGEQIKQVFLNILLNSIEATSEKGQITVKTRSFTRTGGEPYIQIEFADTGHGIPPDHLEEIFNPFFTTKDKGSGLGLAISHQIVQDHRGYIDVESELNKGTSFFVNLPLNQEHPKRRIEDLRNDQDTLNSFGQ